MTLKSKSSIDDVARRAGVSTATVSRSLNEPHRVKQATLEAVRDAVDALGYTPHFGGRALASNKTNTIGAIIPTMDNAIFARGLQALQETLAQAGVTLLVATSDYDAEQEAEQIRALLGRGIDGLLLIGLARPEKTYALLRSHNVKVVIAWSFSEDSTYPCVGFDNRAASARVTECALEFGHRRIAMISGVTEGNDRAAERVEGVRQVLRTHGLELTPDHLIEVPYELEAATAAMETLMALEPRPTVVICGNDVVAAGALIHTRHANISVPRDVSVVGFDDIDLALAVDPPLTTVHVPHRNMGRIAAEALLALRDGAETVTGTELQTKLVVRESLGPPAHKPDRGGE
ncbi:MAG: LacI family DNA-binding transcriptional regulator [Hyphomicrobiaceae bacterium]